MDHTVPSLTRQGDLPAHHRIHLHPQVPTSIENTVSGLQLATRLGKGIGAMATIDFWYSIGSTYSYLTVMRLPGVAQASGVRFRWRPFNVRHVMVTQNNVPFNDKPEKTAHMWHDIARRVMV